MTSYEYQTQGTCSTRIAFDMENDTVHNIRFEGGCSGNLQALSRLAEGRTVAELEQALRGIHCGHKHTSCGDQLVRAVCQAHRQAQENNR